MEIIIRKETKEEYFEVEKLVRESFWDVYRPGCFEHLILHNFRDRDSYIEDLSNIITVDDNIIGQIMFSKGVFIHKTSNEKIDMIVFGPVSILPSSQKKGYGEFLINYSLNRAKEMGFDYVAIFGNPKYYHKFGFDSAINFGVYIDGQKEDEELDFVMVKDLSNSGKISKISGPWIYKDPEGYEVDENELKEFEKLFE